MVSIRTVYEVHYSGNVDRTPWRIHDAEIVDGVTFVPIAAGDRGFVRFVTGGRKFSNLKFFDKLYEARHLACCRAIAQRDVVFDQDPVAPVGGGAYSNVGRASLKRARDDIKHVTVDMPATSRHQGCTMQCMWPEKYNSTLKINLSEGVLDFIRCAFAPEQDGHDDDHIAHASDVSPPKHVAWNNDRKRWVAHRFTEQDGLTKTKYKTFKHSASNLAFCFSEMERWQLEGDPEDGNDDEEAQSDSIEDRACA